MRSIGCAMGVAPLLVLLAGCNSDVQSPLPDGSGFVFDPDAYGATDDLHPPGLRGEIDNYFVSRGSDGLIELISGQTGLPDGGSKAVELTMFDLSASDPCGYEPTVALYVNTGNLGREIWWEFDVKFAPDWRTDFCGGFAEHKLLLVGTSNAGGEARRWDFMSGSGGDRFRMYPSGDTSGASVFEDAAGNTIDARQFFDGQWHTYRGHYRMGTDGRVRGWIDGLLVLDRSGFATADGPDDFFGPVVKLGANMNERPSQQQTWTIGGFRVVTSDPGW